MGAYRRSPPNNRYAWMQKRQKSIPEAEEDDFIWGRRHKGNCEQTMWPQLRPQQAIQTAKVR